MPLDPQAQKLLDLAKALGLPPINRVPISEARQRMASALTYTGEPEFLFSVTESTIPGSQEPIRLRCYRPTDSSSSPAAVFFHGGGWVLNGLGTHDHLCRALANYSGCAIIAVDYRLAPEHPFPEPIEDAWSAMLWIHQNGEKIGVDTSRLGVVGDSSGGTIATIMARRARDTRMISLRCQCLIYPVTDHWSAGFESYRNVGVGYSLSQEMMVWFWENYLQDRKDFDNPDICPLRTLDLRDMPPTLILTAEFDPLRDEGEIYAKRLQDAGVPVVCSRYNGMMHGFVVQFRVLDQGRTGLEETGRFLKEKLL